MAAKEKIAKDKDKELKKGKAGVGAPGEEEEIIEKKPSAPVELTLMIIVFVVMIVGIYLNWSQLSDFYWDTDLYQSQKEPMHIYREFKTQIYRKIPLTELVDPATGGAKLAAPGGKK